LIYSNTQLNYCDTVPLRKLLFFILAAIGARVIFGLPYNKKEPRFEDFTKAK